MTIRLAVVALLLLIAAALVRADVIDPTEPWWRRHESPSVHRRDWLPPGVPLVVAIDETATQARLIVPKQLVRSIAALTGDGETLHADTGRMRWPTIGVPLAAALAVTGLCLTGRRLRIGNRGFAILFGMIALGGVAAFAWGRAQLPTPPPPPPLKGKVTVEVVEDGDAVKLVLNREMLKELMVNK